MAEWQDRADKSPIGVTEVVAIGAGVAALLRIRRRRQRERQERDAAGGKDGNADDTQDGTGSDANSRG